MTDHEHEHDHDAGGGPDRPDDCICFAGAGLPCWPCHKMGFSNPNPDADPIGDEGAE